MPTLTNSFEGGSAGALVTTADTGSGSPWSKVDVGLGSACVYSATGAAHGGLCMAVATSLLTLGAARCGWLVNPANSTAPQWFRLYLDPATVVGTSVVLQGQNTGSTSQRFRVQVTPTGVLTLRNAASSAVWTSAAMTPGTAWRVECRIAGSASGASRVWIYAKDSLAAAQDSGELAAANFGGPIREVWFGQAVSALGVGVKLDDVGWSDVGPLGPALQITSASSSDASTALSIASSRSTSAGAVASTAATPAGAPVAVSASTGTVDRAAVSGAASGAVAATASTFAGYAVTAARAQSTGVSAATVVCALRAAATGALFTAGTAIGGVHARAVADTFADPILAATVTALSASETATQLEATSIAGSAAAGALDSSGIAGPAASVRADGMASIEGATDVATSIKVGGVTQVPAAVALHATLSPAGGTSATHVANPLAAVDAVCEQNARADAAPFAWANAGGEGHLVGLAAAGEVSLVFFDTLSVYACWCQVAAWTEGDTSAEGDISTPAHSDHESSTQSWSSPPEVFAGTVTAAGGSGSISSGWSGGGAASTSTTASASAAVTAAAVDVGVAGLSQTAALAVASAFLAPVPVGSHRIVAWGRPHRVRPYGATTTIRRVV